MHPACLPSVRTRIHERPTFRPRRGSFLWQPCSKRLYNRRVPETSKARRGRMGSLRLLLVLLSFSAIILAADSPLSGTWKFNPSKSHPDPPISKSLVAHV